jgi:hypothetical protein
MIGGCVGTAVANGAGVSPGTGVAVAPGPGVAVALGVSVGGTGAGVVMPPGGLTGPEVGAGAGGFTCAAAPNARAMTNARLVNGARTRRKRLLIRDGSGYAIF